MGLMMGVVEITMLLHPAINKLKNTIMKILMKEEYVSITGGGDLFLYDLFFMIGTVYQSCLDSGKSAKNTPGTNSYIIGLRIGGL
jgi:hypothetical protein